MQIVLINAGPLVAYFDAADALHRQAQVFIRGFRGQFVTTCPVITEAMWLLREDCRVQNELLMLVSRQLFREEALTVLDYLRISELNQQYADLPADFADLSLVAIAERLDINIVVSMDKEFDVYQRRRGRRLQHFERKTFTPK